MKKKTHLNLSEAALKILKKIAYLKTYETETPLHYRGQTPIVAYFIVKGNILLTIGKKTSQKLSRGSLFGFYELHSMMPTNFSAVVQKNSEVGYIDKSMLLEIKNSKIPEMKELYLELTNFPLYS